MLNEPLAFTTRSAATPAKQDTGAIDVFDKANVIVYESSRPPLAVHLLPHRGTVSDVQIELIRVGDSVP